MVCVGEEVEATHALFAEEVLWQHPIHRFSEDLRGEGGRDID